MAEFDKGSVAQFLKSKDSYCRVYFKEDVTMRLYEQLPVVDPDTDEQVDKVILGYDAYEFDNVVRMTVEDFTRLVGKHILYNSKLWNVTFNNGFSLNN